MRRADRERTTPPARDASRLFPPAYAPAPAIVRRGRIEAHVGVGLVLAGSVVGAIAATLGGTPLAASAGAVICQGIVAAGLLASSPVARAIAMAGGALAAFGIVIFAALQTSLGSPSPHASDIALVIGLLLVTIGSLLASIAPAARAWHHLQVARREAKHEATSLMEWRSAGRRKHARG